VNLSTQIRLVAIDLDHTLLTSDWKLNPRDAIAIRHAASAGAIIALTTGRMPQAVFGYAEQLGNAVHYIVSYNGAISINAGTKEIIASTPLSWLSAKRIFDFAFAKGHRIVVFSNDSVWAVGENYEEDAVLSHYRRRTNARISFLPNVASIGHHSLHKFFVYDRRIADAYNPDVESCFENFLFDEILAIGVVELSIVKTRLGYIECMDNAVSKLSALASILAIHGWTFGNLMSIGDGYNDLEMIANARVGVAVANAVKPVKEVAHLVVASNDDCGVAEALNNVFGGG
jgi:Cof subfamily protein (haloacid dehalogenase superfamily)